MIDEVAAMRDGTKTPHPLARSFWFVVAFVTINKLAPLAYHIDGSHGMSGSEFLNWLLLPEPVYICLPFALLICAMNMPAIRILHLCWLLLSAVPSATLLAMLVFPFGLPLDKLAVGAMPRDAAIALMACICGVSAFSPRFVALVLRTTYIEASGS